MSEIVNWTSKNKFKLDLGNLTIIVKDYTFDSFAEFLRRVKIYLNALLIEDVKE